MLIQVFALFRRARGQWNSTSNGRRSPSSIGNGRSDSPAGGFTLIELMIVIAIVAILMMVAIPSFQNLIQQNRVSSEINSFVGDLQYARSEAIKRGQTVSICPSTDAATCLGANTWQSGWIVFSDVNGNGALDNAADSILRTRGAFASTDTFVAAPSLTAITYGRSGFAMNMGAASVLIPVHTSPLNNSATRCVTLNVVGRQTVQVGGAGTCS